MLDTHHRSRDVNPSLSFQARIWSDIILLTTSKDCTRFYCTVELCVCVLGVQTPSQDSDMHLHFFHLEEGQSFRLFVCLAPTVVNVQKETAPVFPGRPKSSQEV